MVDLRHRLRTHALAWAHALSYAIVVTAVATAIALALGIATGGGFVRGKAFLFVTGWLIVAYATLRLWPTEPADLDRGATGGADSLSGAPADGRIEAAARTIPPVRWLQLPPPDARISQAGKHFLAGCAVLLASFLLETVFGVT